MIKIALVNKSTVVTDREVTNCAAALNHQVKSDFGPIWNIQASVYGGYVKGKAIPSDFWIVEVLDVSDQAGALGYHEYTNDTPTAKVFAKTCKDDGVTWSSCASHEILEMLVDPEGVLAALDDTTGKFYSYEVCDAVENQSYHINVWGDFEVSNFATPKWFAAGSKGPYDFLKKCTAPFQLEAGGYTETLDVSQSQGWQQITARSRKKITGQD